MKNSDNSDDELWRKIQSKSENLSYRLSELGECATEPIAFCGAIQPFGLLVVTNSEKLIIEALSANWKTLVGLDFESMIGQQLGEILVFDPPVNGISTEELFNLIVENKISAVIKGDLGGKYQLTNCIRQGPRSIFEFEEVMEESSRRSMEQIKRILVQTETPQGLEETCAKSADKISEILGFDRVMIYRFDQQWNGEVIAESKQPDLPAFLGLHYPASDIPPQARELFAKNQARIIVDVSAKAIPILTHSIPLDQLDLGNTMLRAVSPIHLQYLENMGVRATMALPIIVNGAFWGLVACHHYSAPRYVSPQMRLAADVAVRILSKRITNINERRRLLNKNDCLLIMHNLLSEAVDGIGLVSAVKRSAEKLLQLTSSTSIFVKIGLEQFVLGQQVQQTTLDKLQEKLQSLNGLSVWKTESLMQQLKMENFDVNAAGALAVPMSGNFEDHFVWLRPEVRQEVRWGGQPKVNSANATISEKLTPRASFAEWKEVILGRSRQWTELDQDCAEYFSFSFMRELFSRMQTISFSYIELERAGRLKDEFISTLSHELRNPLGAIVSWIEVAKQDELNSYETMQKTLATIEQNAKKQISLIDDMLDISRITSGKIKLVKKSNVNLTELLSNEVEAARPIASAKKISLEWHPTFNVVFSADPGKLRQIFWNLITNAIKFTDKNGQVQILLDASDRLATVEVIDSGIGIDPSKLKLIFEKFTQIDNDVTKGGKGLGLGLTIVKSFVDLHDGEVIAYSEGKGKGTRFKVTLPISTVEGTKPHKPERTSLSTDPNLYQFGGLRVLLAEDSEDSAAAIQILLGKRGVVTEIAENGKEALRLLGEKKFDLILSDISMPKMDGLELMRLWREEEKQEYRPRTPSIALTAFATDADRGRSIQAGFDRHISKPVDLNELFKNIDEIKGH